MHSFVLILTKRILGQGDLCFVNMPYQEFGIHLNDEIKILYIAIFIFCRKLYFGSTSCRTPNSKIQAHQIIDTAKIEGDFATDLH